MSNNIVIIIFAILNSLFIGYVCGKLSNDTIIGNIEHKPKSFFDKGKTKNTDIVIDDKKFVVDIKTDTLEKKYDKLGDTKTTQENITESVNKLKTMKG